MITWNKAMGARAYYHAMAMKKLTIKSFVNSSIQIPETAFERDPKTSASAELANQGGMTF